MRALAIVVTLALVAVASTPSSDPATVVLIVNDATPAETGTGGVGASQWIANNYIAARGVPTGNVCHINSPMAAGGDVHSYDSWQVQYTAYQSNVETPIKNCLVTKGIKNSTKYLVTTYGVPSHIVSVGGFSGVSIDSMLSKMYDTCGGFSTLCTNPYAQSSASSTPPRFVNFTAPYPMYIVGRLDGPTAVIASALIDKAVAAEAGISKRSGIGYFDWQHSADSRDASFNNANTLCGATKLRCSLNDQSISGGLISSAPNTLWAWGWYSGTSVNDVYTFVPGAVGAQLTSYTCNFIRYLGTGAYCYVWVNKGITATWGASSEPNGDYAMGDILLNHLWAGYNFGESAYMSMNKLGWMHIFLGDPLYSPVLLGPTSAKGSVRTQGHVRMQ